MALPEYDDPVEAAIGAKGELIGLTHEERVKALAELSQEGQALLRSHWPVWAHGAQKAPEGDWHVWTIMAGRGFGKTRAGAEWVRNIAESNPRASIALVADTLGDARRVMVEGESGILAISPPQTRPDYEPSNRRLNWPGGASAMLYGASEPDSLRGPQHSHAWADEIAKWDSAHGRAEAAWDNLMLGLRLGDDPRTVATTTPRAVPLLKRILREEGTVVTRGTTQDNAGVLPPTFIAAMRRLYDGTRLGRQELDGELIADMDGALWRRDVLERCREGAPSAPHKRIVVGVDPCVSATGDACGIVVVALGEDDVGRVLADCTVERATPDAWARCVAAAAREWQADRVVAEANQGGSLVKSVLHAAQLSLPVKLVHAHRGKVARAEPVAALYETGRVRHCGMFGALEDQLCGMMAGGRYEGPGGSPDRADALVWALSELMLKPLPEPRIRGL
ncbi:MAG: terminase family protein [Parerythrobacter sp.]